MNTPEHGSKTDRKDIPAAYKWKIEDIYATPADWEKASGVLRELIQDMEALQGSLSSRDTLLKALRLKDHMSREIEKFTPTPACSRMRTTATPPSRPSPARRKACWPPTAMPSPSWIRKSWP